VSIPIEDYAIIGNCQSIALVSRDASIDWMGLPRFDSEACFAALLGSRKHGRWRIAPTDGAAQIHRRYRHGTLVLETEFTTATGRVVITDCMSRREGISDVFRVIRGITGQMTLRTELVVRFGYGSLLPWVTRLDDGRLRIVAGPDQLLFDTPVETHGEDFATVASFDIKAGETLPFTLSWRLSHLPMPERIDAVATTERVSEGWREWSARCKGDDELSDVVRRSFITLKALTHHETGGIVAAGTTSLPEAIGGPRNWDYRYCWLRDSTFTLYALMTGGFTEEAEAWREWLLRAVAGAPEQMQIMYGVGGERRLTEFTVDWLPGYADSKPVRIGNAAHEQIQLDVYGEVLDAFYQARRLGIPSSEAGWAMETTLIEHLAEIWQEPDEGIWEVRGGRRHFIHSKVMVWVAFDRAVRSIEEFGLPGPLEQWRKLRESIHVDICSKGFNKALNSFTQYYGASEPDASLLLIPLVGFLPAEDPRMRGTIALIERTLLQDGFVRRYNPDRASDGLPGTEGVFLACSFWLVDNYVLQGRIEEAQALFDRLLALRNDVGLLSEEYDPKAKHQLGNFPQAFSHVALINSAHNLMTVNGPARHRADDPD
jgi:GH15 family glucan-1,4-alpha-glucosidase